MAEDAPNEAAPKDDKVISSVKLELSPEIKGGNNDDILQAHSSQNVKIDAGAGDDKVISAQTIGGTIDLGTGNNKLNMSGKDITVNATGAGNNDITIENGQTLDSVGISSETKVKKDADGKVIGTTFVDTETLYNREYERLNHDITVDARGSDTTLNLTDGVRKAALVGDAGDKVSYTSPNNNELIVKPTKDGYSLNIDGNKGDEGKIVDVVGNEKGMPALFINGKEIPHDALKAAMGDYKVPDSLKHPDNSFTQTVSKDYVNGNLTATITEQGASVAKGAGFTR